MQHPPRFRTVQVIKDDAKGRVSKALCYRRWLQVSWVLVKEGPRGACADNAGRDVTDRLAWQYGLYEKLAGTGLTPAALHFLVDDEKALLMTAFIEGTSLCGLLEVVLCGRPLCMASPAGIEDLCQAILKIIDALALLHGHGFLHRDLTPHNILLDKEGRVVFIDLELSYDVQRQLPAPPFGVGSPGYTSPEQAAMRAPTVAQDTYSLGATLLYCFTGLSPAKFQRNDADALKETLLFLIQHEGLSDIIACCLDNNPAARPCLLTIKHTVETFRQSPTFNPPGTPPFVTNFLQAPAPVVNDKDKQPALPAGLFNGSYGAAVALCAVQPPAGPRELVWRYVQQPATGLGMTSGLAGQGLALLYCYDHLPKDNAERLLNAITERLTKEGRSLRSAGLFEGLCGVVLYLLKSRQPAAVAAAREILVKADKMARKTALPPWLGEGFTGLGFTFLKAYEYTGDSSYTSQAEWWLRQHPAKVLDNDFSLANGLAGLGEVYLEAYRLLGDEEWKERAGWICGVLAHTCFKNAGGQAWWLTEHSLVPHPGLLTGNAGVVHFLMRYANPAIGFPLLN